MSKNASSSELAKDWKNLVEVYHEMSYYDIKTIQVICQIFEQKWVSIPANFEQFTKFFHTSPLVWMILDDINS